MQFIKVTIRKKTIWINPALVTFIERGELGGVHIHFRGDLSPIIPRLVIDRMDTGALEFIEELERALVGRDLR